MLSANSCLLTDVVDQLHEDSKKVNIVERLTRHLNKGIPNEALVSYLHTIRQWVPNEPVIHIDNVIQMNLLAMESVNPEAVNTVYNTAYGERTTLNQLVGYLKEYLSEYDPATANVEIVHGPNRAGDIPHSLANIDKAKNLLGYNPQFSMEQGLKEAVKWYWENL